MGTVMLWRVVAGGREGTACRAPTATYLSMRALLGRELAVLPLVREAGIT
jgi:hypothetical protein